MSIDTRKPYTEQRLSRLADVRIRTRLFLMYVRKAYARTLPAGMVAGAVALAVMVLVVVPRYNEGRQVNAFIVAAEAAQLEMQHKSKTDILHQKLVVQEGKDKAAYVAKVKNVPLSDASQVPVRHDTIEEWRHGITNLSIVETDVAGRPVDVRLNLENDDHMHVFAYDPRDCRTQKRDGVITASCSEEQEATETYRAHRSLFDEVHDIQSLYAGDIAYRGESVQPLDVRSLTYREQVTEGDATYFVFEKRSDALEERYYFDAETHLPVKRVIALHDGDERYEMSEIRVVAQGFVKAEEGAEVFDPGRYSFTQLEVIPLRES